MARSDKGTTVVRPTYNDEDSDANRIGCIRLACAVVGQAIADVRDQRVQHADEREWPQIRETAQAFCTSTDDMWSRQREFWALAAGVNPDVLTTVVQRLSR